MTILNLWCIHTYALHSQYRLVSRYLCNKQFIPNGSLVNGMGLSSVVGVKWEKQASTYVNHSLMAYQMFPYNTT